MSTIKVVNSIKVYEVDRKETKIGDRPELKIISHDIDSDRVVLQAEGDEYTILADDFKKGIANSTRGSCTNSIEVDNYIPIYEINHEEVDSQQNEIEVSSYWSWSDFVVLKIKNKKYTVVSEQLKSSINNATNC